MKNIENIHRLHGFGKLAEADFAIAESSPLCDPDGRRPVATSAMSWKDEYVFQGIFFSVFSILGVKIYAEDCTNRGRIDLVIDMPGYTYIVEFKLNDDDSALKQIHEKKYYEKYRLNGKRIILIGVNFSSKSGELCRWETESLG